MKPSATTHPTPTLRWQRRWHRRSMTRRAGHRRHQPTDRGHPAGRARSHRRTNRPERRMRPTRARPRRTPTRTTHRALMPSGRQVTASPKWPRRCGWGAGRGVRSVPTTASAAHERIVSAASSGPSATSQSVISSSSARNSSDPSTPRRSLPNAVQPHTASCSSRPAHSRHQRVAGSAVNRSASTSRSHCSHRP